MAGIRFPILGMNAVFEMVMKVRIDVATIHGNKGISFSIIFWMSQRGEDWPR